MDKLIKIGTLNIWRKEDGGRAIVPWGIGGNEDGTDTENGVHFNVISGDEEKIHTEIDPFVGKRVKITMEIID